MLTVNPGHSDRAAFMSLRVWLEGSLSSMRSVPTVKLDNDGHIRTLKTAHEIEADTSSELATRAAFCRRALAYGQAKLVSFAVMESWHDWIFEQHARDVPDGYAAANMTQLLTADRELFLCAAMKTRSGINPTQLDRDQSWPSRARNNPQVVMWLT